MSRHQNIVFDLTGQTFTYDPPETFRPSGTPTVEVMQAGVDDDTAVETATTGACSVDAVNTTLGAAAAAGATSITVASGTGIVRGRRYLLTDVDGDCEQVECISITSTTVGLRQPLINSYAITSSTFQGCRISIDVDSTWVADKSNLSDALGGIAGAAGYRLRWAYTTNSIATIGVSYADLVRYQAKNLVSPLDVDRRFPGWIDRLGPDYSRDQGAGLIAEAFEAVRMDALGDGQAVRRIRDTEILSELVRFRANLMAIENQVLSGGGAAASEAMRAAQELYMQRYNQLLREPKVPVDQGGGGAAGHAERLPAWRR